MLQLLWCRKFTSTHFPSTWNSRPCRVTSAVIAQIHKRSHAIPVALRATSLATVLTQPLEHRCLVFCHVFQVCYNISLLQYIFLRYIHLLRILSAPAKMTFPALSENCSSDFPWFGVNIHWTRFFCVPQPSNLQQPRCKPSARHALQHP